MDAMIGVHSASSHGIEPDLPLAETTLMARDAHDPGAPPGVLGRIVQTSARWMQWLDPADLRSMSVTIYDGELPEAIQLALAHNRRVTAETSLPPAVSTPAVTRSTFETGRDDRRALETWLSSLRGAYRDGAITAEATIDNRQTAQCYGPGNLNKGDVALGCTVAVQRLMAIG